MARIVITEFMDQAAEDRLKAVHDVHSNPALVDNRGELEKLLPGADALIVRNRTRVDASLISLGERLVCVGRLGVGLDNIDVAACEARSIAVLPATGANALSVAEYVIAGILMTLRGAYQSTADVARGDWPRTRLMGREASGRRLGLVGFGEIARMTASRARALGMTVSAYDPFIPESDDIWSSTGVTPQPLHRLLEEADVVSLHIPLTKDTRHLIDAAAIGRMRKDAVLINTARGGIVDEAALAAALLGGRLGAAMLDVFESEPLPAGSVLQDVPNLILTPHIAGVTDESNQRVSHLIADRVLAALGD